MKRFLLLLTLLSVVSCSSSRRTVGTALSHEKQYVVILSMDGFRWDLAARSHTPTLDSLARVGTYAEIFPVYPSNTFPNHYAMATGLHPDHHGVVNNNFYDKQADRKMSVFNREDVRTPGFWGGEPIWNTVQRQGLHANVFMWTGSDVPIGGHQADVWTKYSSRPSYSQRADWVIDAMTRPEEEIPELVMWYFEQPDAAEHTYGPESPEAVAQAERIDSVLHYFFTEIRRSPVFDRINFIVTADHGMSEVAPERYINLHPLLDTTQVIRTVKGAPFGLEVEPEYVDQALKILRKTGHMRAWQREQMPRRFYYGHHPTRLTNLIIIPQTGWTLDYDLVDNPPRRRGSHGFDNRDRDMHMVFYGSGPAFRKGYEQRSFQNLNMYLVICHILGVEPAPNDGHWSAVKRMFTTTKDEPAKGTNR